MVGGILVGITKWENRVRLTVRGTGSEKRDLCCVETDHDPGFQLGDSIWWHSRTIRWSRKEAFEDVPLKKVGYSYGGGVDLETA